MLRFSERMRPPVPGITTIEQAARFFESLQRALDGPLEEFFVDVHKGLTVVYTEPDSYEEVFKDEKTIEAAQALVERMIESLEGTKVVTQQGDVRYFPKGSIESSLLEAVLGQDIVSSLEGTEEGLAQIRNLLMDWLQQGA